MTTEAKGAELLPAELLWADGGHASDIVLTAMADGQDAIVPLNVVAHVTQCQVCTTHLGNAALLSLHAGRELALAEPHRETRTESLVVKRPFPKLAVAFGLVFAVLGLVPTLLDAPSQLGGARSILAHDIPLFASGLGTLKQKLLGPGSSTGLVLTYGAAALVMFMAFALVKLLPKKEVS